MWSRGYSKKVRELQQGGNKLTPGFMEGGSNRTGNIKLHRALKMEVDMFKG